MIFFIKLCSRLSWRHLFARPGRPDGAPVSVKRNDCCRLGSNIAMAESAMPSKSTGNVAQLASGLARHGAFGTLGSLLGKLSNVASGL